MNSQMASQTSSGRAAAILERNVEERENRGCPRFAAYKFVGDNVAQYFFGELFQNNKNPGKIWLKPQMTKFVHQNLSRSKYPDRRWEGADIWWEVDTPKPKLHAEGGGCPSSPHFGASLHIVPIVPHLLLALSCYCTLQS